MSSVFQITMGNTNYPGINVGWLIFPQSGNCENSKFSQMTNLNWHFSEKIAGKFTFTQNHLVLPSSYLKNSNELTDYLWDIDDSLYWLLELPNMRKILFP